MKKFGYVLLAVAVVFAFVGCGNLNDVRSRNVVTYDCSPEVYEHVNLGYNEGEFGPITVTKGTLVNIIFKGILRHVLINKLLLKN